MLAMLFCFALIAVAELRPLVKKKNWKDVAAFGVLFAVTLTISILNQLGTPIPSTILLMDEWMKKIGLSY